MLGFGSLWTDLVSLVAQKGLRTSRTKYKNRSLAWALLARPEQKLQKPSVLRLASHIRLGTLRSGLGVTIAGGRTNASAYLRRGASVFRAHMPS